MVGLTLSAEWRSREVLRVGLKVLTLNMLAAE
jgi:hypothetical protein